MTTIDPNSAAAIVMRNYGFSLQEVANVGALLLFMHASALHQVISDWRITARDGLARVETRGECQGAWEAEELLDALQMAVEGITHHTARSLGGGES